MSEGRLGSMSVVSGMTLGSRILGLVREVVFARFFGAGAGMDVFVVAFQIPNFLRRLFAEGAFAQAFVPVVSEYRASRSQEEVRELADSVAGCLSLVLFIVTLLGVIASPAVIWAFSSGFSNQPDKFQLAVDMLRVTFPYLMFISLTAFAGGLLNAYDRFGPPAFAPILLNICLIAAALFGAPYFERPAMALAVGVFVAGAAQLFFQLPFLQRIGMLPRLRVDFAHPGVRKIMVLMLPAIFGASVAQINLLIDRHIASYLETGSISWLYFSDRLLEFPLGIFAIALGTVILPGLSRHHTNADTAQFSSTLDWALRWVAVIVVPAACALFVLSGPMLSTLFQYGEFAARDVVMARYSLMAYALGLAGFALVKVLVPGYFARQDTRTPVRIGVVALVFNIVANFLIVGTMVYNDYVAPHAGLALATGLAAWLNAGLLFRGLVRRGHYRGGSGWAGFALRIAVASAVMTALLIYLAGPLGSWIEWGAGRRIGQLAFLVFAGGAAYVLVLLIAGMRPAHLSGARND